MTTLLIVLYLALVALVFALLFGLLFVGWCLVEYMRLRRKRGPWVWL